MKPQPKRKRIVNKALIRKVAAIDGECMFPGCRCDIWPRYLVVHHITSVGAGGDDVSDNLLTLCAWRHQWLHSSGKNTAAMKEELRAIAKARPIEP